MKLMCLRADDYGLSRSVNDAILNIVARGLLKNVSIIINLPSASYRTDKLATQNLALGLHFNLCVGEPCNNGTFASTIVSGGRFLSSRQLRALGEDVFDESVVRDELLAQIERFRAVTGRRPDYLDIHSTFNRKIIKICMETTSELGITYVPTPLEPEDLLINGKLIAWMISDADKTKRYGILPDLMEMNRDINVAIFHPGFVDEDVVRNSSLTSQREDDYEILNREEIKEYFRVNNIVPGKFNEI